MRFHASCAARATAAGYDAVLILGDPGCGKSDFVLRLMEDGFMLVADDQVLVENGMASAPETLTGLLEVRGLGIFHRPFLASAPLRLVIRLGQPAARLPEPELHPELRLPVVTLDPAAAGATARAKLALEAACGRARQLAGAFAA
jgi:HPr kinase/phosphorylase